MIAINLFPWREQQRRQYRKQIVWHIGIAVVLAIITTCLWMQWDKHELKIEQQRIHYLQQQEMSLNKIVKQVRNMEAQKQALIQQFKLIAQLQNQRNLMTEMFNQLPGSVSDNLYLTAWQRIGQKMEFSGRAQSNADIAEFMRKLTAIEHFQNPQLREIKTSSDMKDSYSNFTLDLTLPAAKMR